jgi:hypothetical protein
VGEGIESNNILKKIILGGYKNSIKEREYEEERDRLLA